jgi:hypothetical protein
MSEEKDIVEMHPITREIRDFVIDPDHCERDESEVFRKAKDRLREDGHYKCYICGSEEKLQAHHRAAEYMFNNVVDFELLKDFCEEWDVYGYGKLLKQKPIDTVDDIRNLLILCQPHHQGVNHEEGRGGTGVHNLTFNSWIIQKIALEGANPVPQKGESFEEAMERIDKFQRPAKDC